MIYSTVSAAFPSMDMATVMDMGMATATDMAVMEVMDTTAAVERKRMLQMNKKMRRKGVECNSGSDMEHNAENDMVQKNVPIREVDTGAYLDVMKGLVQEGKSVSIIVAGNSMSPFLIHKRDRVFFEKPNRPLKAGDIVFFQRDNGRYIMHCICRVAEEGYYIVGDAQVDIEGPVREDQIFALITKCERKGKMITSGSFWWEFFEKVWIRMIPLRPLIRGGYEKVTAVFRRLGEL